MTYRRRRLIIVVSALLIVLMARPIPALRTSVSVDNFFPANSRVVQDSNWFEENICPLSTIELLLTFDNALSDNDASRLRYLQHLEQVFRENPNIAGVLSAATYAPLWPRRRSGIGGVIDRKVTQSKVKAIKSGVAKAGLLHIDEENHLETWRMSLRVSNVRAIELDSFVDEIQKTASEAFDRTKGSRFAGESLELSCTGHLIILDFVEKQFLRDLIVTYGTAFVFISIVILLVMRSLIGVGLASAPNIFPAVVVLGGISLAKINLDVGSLMTASIALGIAVDDTLHFVLWWRTKVREGMNQHDAIVHAMQHCGLAMVQTTVVCGVSVALYAFCGFLPTVRFGLLLSAMLFAAIAGDLLLLPAILSTRFGRYIAVARNRA